MIDSCILSVYYELTDILKESKELLGDEIAYCQTDYTHRRLDGGWGWRRQLYRNENERHHHPG